MSQENVEIVRAAFEAWIKGDVDTVLEAYDPACEWDNTHWEAWPEDDVYYGREGVRRLFEEWLASWESFEAGADEYLGVGDDRVLIVCWQRGSGPGSHVPVRMDWALLCTLQGGLVRRVRPTADRREALEAVGLSRIRERPGEVTASPPCGCWGLREPAIHRSHRAWRFQPPQAPNRQRQAALAVIGIATAGFERAVRIERLADAPGRPALAAGPLGAFPRTGRPRGWQERLSCGALL